MICYPHYSLASPKNIGVYNSTLEYVSTTSILKPFEKNFLNKGFSPQISSKTPSPQETEFRKREKKKEKEKSKRKKNFKSLFNKEEVNISRGEKHFDFKNTFRCDSIFSLSTIPFQKPFPKSLRKFS
jgi:hypothetical protein